MGCMEICASMCIAIHYFVGDMMCVNVSEYVVLSSCMWYVCGLYGASEYGVCTHVFVCFVHVACAM